MPWMADHQSRLREDEESQVGEIVVLQLHAEAFNVLNHTNFRNLRLSRALTTTTLDRS